MIYYVSNNINNIMDDKFDLVYCLTDNVWEWYFLVHGYDVLIFNDFTWYEL